jgi:hypothetical protein
MVASSRAIQPSRCCAPGSAACATEHIAVAYTLEPSLRNGLASPSDRCAVVAPLRSIETCTTLIHEVGHILRPPPTGPRRVPTLSGRSACVESELLAWKWGMLKGIIRRRTRQQPAQLLGVLDGMELKCQGKDERADEINASSTSSAGVSSCDPTAGTRHLKHLSAPKPPKRLSAQALSWWRKLRPVIAERPRVVRSVQWRWLGVSIAVEPVTAGTTQVHNHCRRRRPFGCECHQVRYAGGACGTRHPRRRWRPVVVAPTAGMSTIGNTGHAPIRVFSHIADQ